MRIKYERYQNYTILYIKTNHRCSNIKSELIFLFRVLRSKYTILTLAEKFYLTIRFGFCDAENSRERLSKEIQIFLLYKILYFYIYCRKNKI